MDVCDLPVVRQLIERALAEDVGGGDITTRLTVPADRRARAAITAKQHAVIAGLPLVSRVCAAVGGDIAVVTHVTDGTHVTPGAVLATLSGPAAALLVAERLSLNFLQHLSGVATLTARFVDAVRGQRCRIVDTRKTTPGLRVLEKYAVRVGGGYNHRTRPRRRHPDQGQPHHRRRRRAAGGGWRRGPARRTGCASRWSARRWPRSTRRWPAAPTRSCSTT